MLCVYHVLVSAMNVSAWRDLQYHEQLAKAKQMRVLRSSVIMHTELNKLSDVDGSDLRLDVCERLYNDVCKGKDDSAATIGDMRIFARICRKLFKAKAKGGTAYCFYSMPTCPVFVCIVMRTLQCSHVCCFCS